MHFRSTIGLFPTTQAVRKHNDKHNRRRVVCAVRVNAIVRRFLGEMKMFDIEPDADIHSECANEIRGLLAELKEANTHKEELAKCCGQRGARLQMMRAWLQNEPCDYPYTAITKWDAFVSARKRLFGDDPDTWFDNDGVPL